MTRRAVVVALLGIFVVALGFFLFRPSEPSYHWRSLESWLGDFRLVGGPGHEKAKAAVRQMGTNAIPKLIEMLRAEDLPWKLKIRDWTETWPIKYRFHPASIKHWRAMTALEALGPAAVPVLLDLQDYPPRNVLLERDAILEIG